MYMDDVMKCVSNVEKAVGLRHDLTELLGLARMKIRKLCSNEPDVLRDIPVEDRADNIHLEDGNMPTIKTLAVLWKSKEDVFTFQLVATLCDDNLTKRKVISLMSKIFDPLQILAPYTTRAKILMQQSWLRGVDWDDPLPTDLAELWKTWLEHLPDLASLQLPRCYSRKGKTVVMGTVNTFVDASACAAVSYLRQEYDDVPGKYNPADKATRGLTAKELVNDKEWLFGPSFLYEDPSKWPEQHFEDSKEAQE